MASFRKKKTRETRVLHELKLICANVYISSRYAEKVDEADSKRKESSEPEDRCLNSGSEVRMDQSSFSCYRQSIHLSS